MNCKSVQTIVIRDGEASGAEWAEARRHIGQCSVCRGFAADFAAIRESAAAEVGALSSAVVQTIMKAGQDRLRERRRLWFPAHSRILAAAAVALAMAGASLLLLPGTRDSETGTAFDALLALTETEATLDVQLSDDATKEQRIEALSRRLLEYQGFDAGLGIEDAFFTLDFEELPPTGTQGHRTGGDPSRTRA